MMGRRASVLALCLFSLPAQAGQDPALPERIVFNRDIRPILSENCFKCHGPDRAANKSGLRLDSREGATAAREGVFAVVPGKPDRSELVSRILSKDTGERMPPPQSNKTLAPRQIALLKKWIEQGAEYQGHWAFIPPQRPAVPRVKNAAWVRNPIDAFILGRLEAERLAPSAEADGVTLLRRLSFDLTGLPPRPEEAEGKEAYEKHVERLLASPHYGERMALLWLDLVRFANSRGYHSDNPRMVDPYRDYVISAFNENLPFDRFTTEQLAGDLLPEATLRQRVASGFNKLNQTTEEGGAQAKEYENKTNADRVRAVSTVWLAVTMGCAECHDHKFDPFSTREFYSLAAFFSDVKERAIGDGDRGILVPDARQAEELRKFDEAIARLKSKLETPTPELAAAQAGWERTALDPFPWTVLVPQSVKSAGNASFAVEEDGSVVASGASPAKDTHTVVARTALKGITGFRLEVLSWPSLPGNGPGRAGNGNLVLTKFLVRAGDKAATLQKPVADHSQDQFPVAAAIDAKEQTGWGLLPLTGRGHEAVFETKDPVGGDPETLLTFTLEYQSVHPQHAAGRFRLSATNRKGPSEAALLPAPVRAALLAPAGKRDEKAIADYYRSIAPLLSPVRSELAEAEQRRADFVKTITTCLVSSADMPRTVRVRPRGNWLDDSGAVVEPGTPGSLHPLPAVEGRRPTRVDLARWMVSRENPLTARVLVNRLWKAFFGLGISRVLDDLGAQGEWPVHPELLDWLAVEFMESGWDVKHLVRLMATSSTYRQASTVRSDLRERDPLNRLLARQSRWRIDAEHVRDNALAVSGLLADRVGGVSVYPYQPAGYWYHLNFPKREWKNDAGESQYRRGIYTWWQRTFPHPSLSAFDAPDRQESCAERTRSNIPQQALVLLNDPTYVEAARVLAEKILRQGGADEDRIQWAFRRALIRKARPEEVRVLAGLHAKHLEFYRAERKSAEQLVSVGQAPVPKDLDVAEHAAWTSVARTILNLHETITRN
jgi:hypothetical protein